MFMCLRLHDKNGNLYEMDSNGIYIVSFSYSYIEEEVSFGGQVLEIQILIDLRLKSLESEYHILAIAFVCMCVSL